MIHYGQPTSDHKVRLIASDDPFESLELSDGQELEVHKLLAPVPRPPVIYAIGLNYWGHINATHEEPPKTPSLFFKNIFAYNHPYQPIIIPEASVMPDYEGELGVVLSKDCKDVSESDALSCVLGYTVCHDVSARCFQMEESGSKHKDCLGNGGQFSFSKGLDTHAPLGPALVPTAVLGDGSGLRLQTRVNGELRQNESTSSLIFGVKKIVSFISTGTTLPRGAVICTGTPDGVGDTLDPPVYLQDGDVVDISIEGIGTLSNPVSRPGAAAPLPLFGLDRLV
jgi:2-keto-4-pentenoate hydratase/2-oxohepta-3-ene-1,7-dioic acid hydratase in catechol pathway